MGVVRITGAGLQTSVQDFGRLGHAGSGVPRGGAFDAVSLRVGNRLVGNDERAAGIEMTLQGAGFRFDRAALICLAGAASDSWVVHQGRRRAVERWRPVVVHAGDELRVGSITGGARSYLCISGGVRTPMILASRSTLVSGALGQRALREGDGFEVGASTPGLRVSALDGARVRALDAIIARRTLRVTPGAHHALFPRTSLRAFTGRAFVVSPQSDRVGIRCIGTGLGAPDMAGLGSEGVIPGCVQVPPSGEPIVLGVDGPTTGGYAVPACVISADLAALGQCAPGDEIRFAWVERDEAVSLLHEQERLILSIAVACVSGRYERGASDGS